MEESVLQEIGQIKKAFEREFEKTIRELSALMVRKIVNNNDEKESSDISLLEDRLAKYLEKLEKRYLLFLRSPENYLKCEACGEKIPIERLINVPVTRQCCKCKNHKKKKS